MTRVRVRELERPVTGLPPAAALVHSPGEVSVVAGLLHLIEGNDVLSGPLLITEEGERCYRSICEFRRLLGDTRLLLPDDSFAVAPIAAMRAACRKYMDASDAWDKRSGRRYSMPAFQFYQHLGALRAVVGLHAWRLAEAYDLEVEGRLTALFPGNCE